MTWEEREAIFSKEAISNEDMQKLLGVSPGTASQKMTEMKRRVGDRLHIQGKIHVQDYLDACNLVDSYRYTQKLDDSVLALLSALTSTQKAYELLKAYSVLVEKRPDKVQSVRKTVCYFEEKE